MLYKPINFQWYIWNILYYKNHFYNRLNLRIKLYTFLRTFLNKEIDWIEIEKQFTSNEGAKIIYIAQFYGKSKSCFPHVTFPTMRRCHPSIYPADSGYVPKTVEIRVNVQPRCSMETNGDFGCHFCLCGYVLEQWPKFISSFIMKLQILWYT